MRRGDELLRIGPFAVAEARDERIWHLVESAALGRERSASFLRGALPPRARLAFHRCLQTCDGAASLSDSKQAATPDATHGFPLPLPEKLPDAARTMTKPKTLHPDTLSVHAGAAPDPATGARATPIYQTASFVFRDTDQAAALFNMERAGHVYSRISNPTCAVLEERV